MNCQEGQICCPICANQYSNLNMLQLPRKLDCCNKTICTQCIAKIVNYKQSEKNVFNCPFCQSKQKIRKIGTYLRQNKYIKQFKIDKQMINNLYRFKIEETSNEDKICFDIKKHKDKKPHIFKESEISQHSECIKNLIINANQKHKVQYILNKSSEKANSLILGGINLALNRIKNYFENYISSIIKTIQQFESYINQDINCFADSNQKKQVSYDSNENIIKVKIISKPLETKIIDLFRALRLEILEQFSQSLIVKSLNIYAPQTFLFQKDQQLIEKISKIDIDMLAIHFLGGFYQFDKKHLDVIIQQANETYSSNQDFLYVSKCNMYQDKLCSESNILEEAAKILNESQTFDQFIKQCQEQIQLVLRKKNQKKNLENKKQIEYNCVTCVHQWPDRNYYSQSFPYTKKPSAYFKVHNIKVGIWVIEKEI